PKAWKPAPWQRGRERYVNASAGLQSPTGAAPPAPLQNALFGRFMLPDMSEHACQVNGKTIDGATFITSHVPPTGQPIVAYLEEAGRIEATSAEPVEGGFLVTFSLTGARRDRLEQRLRWIAEKQQGKGSIE